MQGSVANRQGAISIDPDHGRWIAARENQIVPAEIQNIGGKLVVHDVEVVIGIKSQIFFERHHVLVLEQKNTNRSIRASEQSETHWFVQNAHGVENEGRCEGSGDVLRIDIDGRFNMTVDTLRAELQTKAEDDEVLHRTKPRCVRKPIGLDGCTHAARLTVALKVKTESAERYFENRGYLEAGEVHRHGQLR